MVDRDVVGGSGVDASAEDGGCGGVGGDRGVTVTSLGIERGGVSCGRVGDCGGREGRDDGDGDGEVVSHCCTTFPNPRLAHANDSTPPPPTPVPYLYPNSHPNTLPYPIKMLSIQAQILQVHFVPSISQQQNIYIP
jgi:hypothetical protein